MLYAGVSNKCCLLTVFIFHLEGLITVVERFVNNKKTKKKKQTKKKTNKQNYLQGN